MLNELKQTTMYDNRAIVGEKLPFTLLKLKSASSTRCEQISSDTSFPSRTHFLRNTNASQLCMSTFGIKAQDFGLLAANLCLIQMYMYHLRK